jgi:catalase
MEQSQCSETSAYKIQTPAKYSKKEYNVHNTAKIWNQELFPCTLLSKLKLKKKRKIMIFDHPFFYLDIKLDVRP